MKVFAERLAFAVKTPYNKSCMVYGTLYDMNSAELKEANRSESTGKTIRGHSVKW